MSVYDITLEDGSVFSENIQHVGSLGTISAFSLDNPIEGNKVFAEFGTATSVGIGFKSPLSATSDGEDPGTGFYLVSANQVGVAGASANVWTFNATGGHHSSLSILPSITRTFDLGSAALEWNAVFGLNATLSGLTATRVIYAGVGGLLSESAALTWASPVLTIGTASATTGQLSLLHASSANVGSVVPPSWGGTRTLTLPDITGTLESQANKDTASGYAGLNSASRITKGADTTDDIIIDLATKGLVLKDTASPAHYWRVSVSVAGALTTSDLGTTKP